MSISVLLRNLFLSGVIASLVVPTSAFAASCETICAAATEQGFTDAQNGDGSQCCCMSDANGVVVSQPVEVCQAPAE